MRNLEIFDNGIVGETDQLSINCHGIMAGGWEIPPGWCRWKGKSPSEPLKYKICHLKDMWFKEIETSNISIASPTCGAAGDISPKDRPALKAPENLCLLTSTFPASSFTCYSTSFCFTLGMYNTKSYRENFCWVSSTFQVTLFWYTRHLGGIPTNFTHISL